MNKKYLQIIPEKDKAMVEKIAGLLEKFDTAMTPIQIHNFVLNEIEFPTDYAKFVQSKLELASRFDGLIKFYYDYKEIEVEIKKLERKLEQEKDDLERELLELRKEREEIKMLGIKRQLNSLLRETREFYLVYEKNKKFDKLPPEKKFELEAEGWAKKCLNTPTIFEERYGEGFMKKALGEANYQQYKELRQKGFGLLPREIFELKQLEKSKPENIK